MFRRQATGRARDFNWHNVIGFWCAPVLIVLTASGVGDLLSLGEQSGLPADRQPASAGGRRGGLGQAGQVGQVGRHGRWDARATRGSAPSRQPGSTLGTRGAAGPGVAIDDDEAADSGRRSGRVHDHRRGAVECVRPLSADPRFARAPRSSGGNAYENNTLGQKARGWLRFAHTGELGGIAGQTVAGIAASAAWCWCGRASRSPGGG